MKHWRIRKEENSDYLEIWNEYIEGTEPDTVIEGIPGQFKYTVGMEGVIIPPPEIE